MQMVWLWLSCWQMQINTENRYNTILNSFRYIQWENFEAQNFANEQFFFFLQIKILQLADKIYLHNILASGHTHL